MPCAFALQIHLQYLRLNGGGNEFRENDEMFSKWYKADGSLNEEKVKQKTDAQICVALHSNTL